VAIRFTDTQRVWELEVRNGMIKHIAPADQTQAPIRFDVDRHVFRDIVEGRISPQKAFFARKTNIRGDLLGGMRLAKLLAIFFKQHPWNGDGYPTTV
jgi:putative sterol carrier protein